MTLSLSQYAGKEIIFGFTTEWDSAFSEVDLDNLLAEDLPHNNIITDSAACEGDLFTLTGSTVQGGVGPLTYLWQESYDRLTWENAGGETDNLYYRDTARVSAYYRRIIADTLFPPDTSNTLFIKIIPYPAIHLSGDTAGCFGHRFSLTATGGEQYLWNTGSNDSAIYVNHTGTYSVTVTNSYGCETSDSVYIQVSVCSGKEALTLFLHVWPNPVNEYLTIEGLDGLPRGTSLQIVDMLGRTVWTGKKPEHSSIANRSLAQGCLSVTDPGKKHCSKDKDY